MSGRGDTAVLCSTGARATLLAISVMLPAPVRARACPELSVPADAANACGELQLGAANVNAALGSGAPTATVSRCGEITSVKWPGPSFCDQLAYLTSNAADARRRPHFGALDDMGVFAGIAYRTGRGRGFSWLRDDDWTHTQHYSADTSDVAVSEASHAGLGLHVTAWTFVLPDRNVLVNQFEVTRAPASPVRSARLVFYTNFSPSLARIQFIPLEHIAVRLGDTNDTPHGWGAGASRSAVVGGGAVLRASQTVAEKSGPATSIAAKRRP